MLPGTVNAVTRTARKNGIYMYKIMTINVLSYKNMFLIPGYEKNQ